jgi:3-hydroxymyristoyl/3-hydroxydecanoyl-(acyl carrier protein) dehydratase
MRTANAGGRVTDARGETPLDIDARHPAFEGHFPGRPILPGVVLLSEAMAVLATLESRPPQQWLLASAKFLSPAQPGEPLTMTHERLASGAVRWQIRAGDRLVASGLATPRTAESPAP